MYIAFSARGYPAPFIGVSYTRRALCDAYLRRFGHTLESAGYRAVKVQVSWEAR